MQCFKTTVHHTWGVFGGPGKNMGKRLEKESSKNFSTHGVVDCEGTMSCCFITHPENNRKKHWLWLCLFFLLNISLEATQGISMTQVYTTTVIISTFCGWKLQITTTTSISIIIIISISISITVVIIINNNNNFLLIMNLH